MRLLFLFVLGSAFGLLAGCGTKPKCSPSSCSGCCTADDQCVAGTSTSQCGSGGNACDVCVGGQVCGVGRCETSNLTTMDAGSTMDAGATMDAGTGDGGVTTGPITAPNEAWTWVDFPNSECGNGSATGIGVNLSNRSTDVIIFMQGGGACWNSTTCSLGFASNFNGYGGASFATDSIKNQVAFNRSNMANPFRNASFVFIPYCTGDVHTGDSVTAYGAHHKGAANVRAFLERLAPTFPGSRRIWLTGTSAGGYGVQLNYHRFAAAFPQAEVHGLADSAQMINPAQASLLAEWLAAWNVSDPPGCTGCTQNFNLVPAWLSTTYPNRRFALLAFTRDSTLSQFFQLGYPEFEAATTTLLTGQYQNKANLKYYAVEPANPTHVMLNQLFTRTVGGVTLSSWTQKWAYGEAGWENVRGP